MTGIQESKKSTAVVIPVYNEHHTINALLDNIRDLYPELQIVLVDDGSYPVIEIQSSSGIYLLRNQVNQGKGFSLRKGIEFALNRIQADRVITMDADGQHAPDDIALFLEQLDTHPFLIGMRTFSGKYMPFDRILSNSLSSFLLSKKLGFPIKDSQCGFRAFQKETAYHLLNCSENGFQFETEAIIHLAELGIQPKFVPIQTIYNGSTSHINKFADILTFSKLYFKR